MDTNKIPVIIGTAQIIDREKTEHQIDPLQMMSQVCGKAAKDASLGDLSKIDTLFIVNCLSNFLQSPARDLSALLGIEASDTAYSGIGATAPQWFINQAAKKIFSGKSELVLICGAETFYTRQKLPSLDETLGKYFSYDQKTADSLFPGDLTKPLTDLEIKYGLGLPIYMYALFENALRAHQQKSIPEHLAELAGFCAESSKIASKNEFSRLQKPFSAHEIGTIDNKNKMIVFPYTKLMCSNIFVNQAAAVIMTSAAKARSLGVEEDKIIYLSGCGDARDNFIVTKRPDLWASPSVADAVNQALIQASILLDDVEYLDLYSCFPCAPRIAAQMLGINPGDSRPLTVTGSMPYFGGPGNNYSLHAISRMIDILRQNPKSYGLVQALSWFISKHSVGIYSASSGKKPWTPHDPSTKQKQYPEVNVVKKAHGKAVIESYIVDYDKNGRTHEAVVVGRDSVNNRFIAKVYKENGLLEHMTTEEPIGKHGKIKYDENNGINIFYF